MIIIISKLNQFKTPTLLYNTGITGLFTSLLFNEVGKDFDDLLSLDDDVNRWISFLDCRILSHITTWDSVRSDLLLDRFLSSL